MKHDSFKTYLHWGLTAFGVVALSILFFFSLFKVGALVHFFQTLTGILMPFVYGLAMAYLLTPVFNWLHARFAPALQKTRKKSTPCCPRRKISFHDAFGAAGAAACSRAAVDGAAAGDLQHRRAGGIQSADEQHPERDGLDRGHASEQPAVRSCRTAGICRSRGSSHRMGKNGHAAPADEPDERAAGHPDLFQRMYSFGIIIAIYVLNSKQLFAATGQKLLYGCLSTAAPISCWITHVLLTGIRRLHQRQAAGFPHHRHPVFCWDDSAAHAVCDAHQRGGGRQRTSSSFFRAVYRCHSQRAAYPSHRPAQGALLRAFYPCAAAIRRQYPGPKNSGRFHRPFQLLGDVRHSCWPAGCSGLSAWSSACRCLRCCTASSPGWCGHSLRRRGMRRKHRPIMNWTMWMSAHTTSYTMRLRPGRPRDLRTGAE